MTNRLSPETIAEIKRLRYVERLPQTEVAARLGVGINSITRHARGAKAKTTGEKVRELADAGMDTASIRRELGLRPEVIRRHIPAGVTHRVYSDEEKQFALRLLEDGAGYGEAARTLGTQPRRIRSWFPGMALPPSEAARMSRLIAEGNKILDNLEIGGYNG
jgi:DNA-binding transcriptional regulator YiaG